MKEAEIVVDDHKLAEDVANHIKIETTRDFLIKPLPKTMVKKEFEVPIPKDPSKKKDDNGVEAVDFEETKKEIKEVPSRYRRGIILKIPYEYRNIVHRDGYMPMEFKVGDVVIYDDSYRTDFDHVKDTKFVKLYDIVGIER